MSEPIQSIAQNNYILATQQEISHDNTLSGNGTVDSPLGVVHGYNETVLYDNPTNNNVTTTAEFVMNESLWNFHRAFIEFDNMEFTGQPLNMEIDLDISTTGTSYYTPMRNGNSFPELNIPFANFYINSAGNIKYTNRGLLYGPWSNIHTTTGDKRGYRVRKVIGINRIANS